MKENIVIKYKGERYFVMKSIRFLDKNYIMISKIVEYGKLDDKFEILYNNEEEMSLHQINDKKLLFKINKKMFGSILKEVVD